MNARALLSLSPARARWFYAAAACAFSMGMFFAPFNVYFGFAIGILAGMLGYGLGRREDGLRADSATDTLTGLFNRRYFELTLLRELARCARDGRPLALLMIDVDALKTINDGRGHDAGDGAIRAVADALRDSCRSADLAARWGGDEFVVLAPQTSEPEAMGLAKRISDRVIASTSAGGTAPSVSVSIGVAIASGRAVSSEQLFARADAAMFLDKDRVRDDPTPVEGNRRPGVLTAQPAARARRGSARPAR